MSTNLGGTATKTRPNRVGFSFLMIDFGKINLGGRDYVKK